MAGILNLLGGSELLNGISQQAGVSKEQTSSVMELALPMLMGAMQKNSQSASGAESLLGALQSDKHNGSLLSGLGSLLGGNASALTQDGAGILGHLLGSGQDTAANAISQKTGVSSGAVSQILKMAAPVLMSYLGKQVSEKGVNSAEGLGGILSSVLGGQNASGMLSFLDQDKDGNVIDDIAGMVLGKDNPLSKLF